MLNPRCLILKNYDNLNRKESEAIMKRALLFFIAIFVVFIATTAKANKSVHEWAFTCLNFARDEKTQQLRRFCDKVHRQAVYIKNVA